jgi:hypothetical protein
MISVNGIVMIPCTSDTNGVPTAQKTSLPFFAESSEKL